MKCPFVIKVCTKCKRILVANEMNFNKEKKGKYGLFSECKECRKKYYKNNKEHYKEYRKEYNKSNKEYRKEYNKRYYEDNKEGILKQQKQHYEDNKEEVKERNKEYYEKNKEHYKEYQKQWRENNKEYIKEQKTFWDRNNPNKIFNYNNKRRELENNQGDGIAKEQWLEMMQFFDWKCAYSGEKLNNKTKTIDHIIPLSKGGEHEVWNMCPMYRNYNSSKRTQDMEDWYIQQSFFDIDRLLKIYEWIEYAWNKWGNK